MLLKALLAIQAIHPGIDTRRVLAINVPVISYGRTDEQVVSFYKEAIRRVHDLPGVDAVGLEQRAAALATRSIKTSSKKRALDTIVSLIDLTTPEGADTAGKVRSLVAKAILPDPADPTCPQVAERSAASNAPRANRRWETASATACARASPRCA